MGRKTPEILEKFDPRRGARALDGLVLAQQGVFAGWQVSVSHGLLSPRIRARTLHRIHQGVYALVPEPLLTPNGRRMAAVLACGPGAALSHYSNPKLRGLLDSSRSRIDVTVPRRSGRSRTGIHIHRSATLRRQDIELVQGIPCTTLARTIFDMAGVLKPRQLERLLDEAGYQQVLDANALNDQIEHNRSRARACARLRKALADHRVGSTLTDGPLGEEMLALIRSTDLPEPKVQHWIDLQDGEPVIQADFAWPEARVILETDGQRAHGQPKRTMSDYRRDQRAASAGWHTLRFAARQVRQEPERVKKTLTTVVRSRLEQRAAPKRSRRQALSRAAPG